MIIDIFFIYSRTFGSRDCRCNDLYGNFSYVLDVELIGFEKSGISDKNKNQLRIGYDFKREWVVTVSFYCNC